MKDFNSYFESIPELETERLRLTAFTREDRVILANPGAGKSVLLLSKAFKYASMYKATWVLHNHSHSMVGLFFLL